MSPGAEVSGCCQGFGVNRLLALNPFFEHGLELYAGRTTPEGRAFSRETEGNPKPPTLKPKP